VAPLRAALREAPVSTVDADPEIAQKPVPARGAELTEARVARVAAGRLPATP